MTPEISIVVPLRDEEPSVTLLHAELSAVMPRTGRAWELILVDDGSVDGTLAAAEAVQARDPRVRVVSFDRNYGQTAAFAAGFARARGDLVVTLDGDLQNDPADIPRLVDLASRFDVVCGWRRQRQDAFLTRSVPSTVANWLLGLVSGVRIHDNGCSLKVFRTEFVRPLALRPGMHRFLPALASARGARIAEVVVGHRPRRFGRSKYGLSRTFRVLADLVRLRGLMRRAASQAHALPEPWYHVAWERGAGVPDAPSGVERLG